MEKLSYLRVNRVNEWLETWLGVRVSQKRNWSHHHEREGENREKRLNYRGLARVEWFEKKYRDRFPILCLKISLSPQFYL